MNDKQIKNKTAELLKNIRLYQRGFIESHFIKNAFNCLFIDLMLDDINKNGEEKLQNGCFDKMLEEW